MTTGVLHGRAVGLQGMNSVCCEATFFTDRSRSGSFPLSSCLAWSKQGSTMCWQTECPRSLLPRRSGSQRGPLPGRGRGDQPCRAMQPNCPEAWAAVAIHLGLHGVAHRFRPRHHPGTCRRAGSGRSARAARRCSSRPTLLNPRRAASGSPPRRGKPGRLPTSGRRQGRGLSSRAASIFAFEARSEVRSWPTPAVWVETIRHTFYLRRQKHTNDSLSRHYVFICSFSYLNA